jgi:hypothetical protein
MIIWMKNFGLSLKLGAATDLLLENTGIKFQPVTCMNTTGVWHHHTWQSAAKAYGRVDSE